MAALSRVSPQEKIEIKGLDVTNHELIPHLTRISEEKTEKATQGDKTFKLLIYQMLEGWPECYRSLC